MVFRYDYSPGERYPYRLVSDYDRELDISEPPICLEYIRLVARLLTIQEGYAWDGPSGPAVDTQSFMRASCVHDALYQLIRIEKLPMKYRPFADAEMRRIAKEDGMPFLRRWWTWGAVRLFGRAAARP